MKIKIDENLPSRLANLLKNFGHDVHNVHDERLIGHLDSEIWRAAQGESRFLITQDLDFADSRQFVPGQHSGILLVRLRSPSRRSLIERITEIFQNESIHEWAGCFVVATERKIRVRKPKE
jgi:predicted nuclease of predicted toxin-antitoxin system